MKNLNKKIGVVALSGLIVIGGSLASGSSAFAYQQVQIKNGYYVIGQQWFSQNPLDKSKYESEWKSLRRARLNENDLDRLIQFGEQAGSSGYKIKAMSAKSEKHPDIKYISYGSNANGLKVQKYFNSVEKFWDHVWNIGMPNNKDYKICIAGVDYIMRFK